MRRRGAEEYVLVLGSVEALCDRVSAWQQHHPRSGVGEKMMQRAQALEPLGFRLLLLAAPDEPISLSERTTLPDVPLRPLALISLGDELRPEAGQVLEALAKQGIAFKVISGDNPNTVRGTVRHLNIPIARPVIRSCPARSWLPRFNPAELIESHSVFGRVTPDQKVR